MNLFFRPVRLAAAFLLPFLGLAVAFGQPSQDRSRVRDEADLARVTRWAQAGMGGRSVDRELFQVQVGVGTSSLSQGFVSFSSLPEGPSSLIASGVGGTAVLARLFIPATGLFEVFLIYVPPTDPTLERPLLTAFHSFGISHGSIATLTTYLRECQDRDWFLLAPIQSGGPGLSQVSYGSINSQLHVEAVIGLMLEYYEIDRDRLYGVGFSMGGGNVMSYATRHRDRRKGAFAAIMNHTGTVSLADTYEFVPVSVRPIMETLFFGTPTDTPFEWTRASSIVLDSTSQLIPNADHMAVNLTNIPIKTIYGITDPNQYLIDQSIQLDAFFQSVGATNHILEPTPETTECPEGHCWNTADEFLVCEWLTTQTLNPNPTSGTILVDRSARWGRFDLQIDAQDAFGGLKFEVDPAAKSLTITGVRNLSEVAVDPSRIDLDVTGAFTVSVLSEELGGDDYRIRNYPALPTGVERDGQPVLADCAAPPGTPSWCYDRNTGDLVLYEPGGQVPAVWTIFP